MPIYDIYAYMIYNVYHLFNIYHMVTEYVFQVLQTSRHIAIEAMPFH